MLAHIESSIRVLKIDQEIGREIESGNHQLFGPIIADQKEIRKSSQALIELGI